MVKTIVANIVMDMRDVVTSIILCVLNRSHYQRMNEMEEINELTMAVLKEFKRLNPYAACVVIPTQEQIDNSGDTYGSCAAGDGKSNPSPIYAWHMYHFGIQPGDYDLTGKVPKHWQPKPQRIG
jgi:hypothetical protein